MRRLARAILAALAVSAASLAGLPEAGAAPITVTIADQGDAAALDGHMRSGTTARTMLGAKRRFRVTPRFDEHVFAHETRLAR